MISEEFDHAIEKYGAPRQAISAPEPYLRALEGRLPERYIKFCRQFCFGAWGDGLFRFCEPDFFSSIIETVFHQDPEISAADCAAIGYSAFAELHIWNRQLGLITVDLVFKAVDADFLAGQKQLDIRRRLGPDRVSGSRLVGIVENSEMRDNTRTPLFARARKLLGDLQPGECYGFVPAIGLGGANELQYLRRTRALEHFSIIAGLAPFELMTYEGAHETVVRRTGPQ